MSLLSSILTQASVPHLVVASEPFLWYHGGSYRDDGRKKPLFLAERETDAMWYAGNSSKHHVYAFELSGPHLDLRNMEAIESFLATVRSLGITFDDDPFFCREIQNHCGYDGSHIWDLFYIPVVLDHFAKTYSYVRILDALLNDEVPAAISIRPDGRKLRDVA